MELGVEEGGLVARGLELAVRLPPLYLMDTILVHNLGVSTDQASSFIILVPAPQIALS